MKLLHDPEATAANGDVLEMEQMPYTDLFTCAATAEGDVPCKFMTLMQASPQKSAFQTTLPVCHQERELEGEGELEWTHGNVARLE